MDRIEKILGEIGLYDREVKVYLATLELGESTVLPIATKAGIKRTYCYDILADLEKKHLVTHFEKNGRRRYVATDPKGIEKMIKEHVTNFQIILPELSALYKPNKEKPSVRFFEGADEIKRIYEEIGESKQMLGYGSFTKIVQFYPEFPQFVQKYLKTGPFVRDLALRTPEALELQKLYVSPKQEMRFLPPDMTFQTDNIIFDDKVAMISYGETIHGLLVESKAIAETQTRIFEELWKISAS